ncbi:P-loop containing nucleoside triphosphate hydrolase [Arabidopsis suecica]|uniref:P-loop containing nucleoside triphosphate hydrolase n=1 Tax=Arabidopsis suecica TaxID=45249 RepID=A0A8T1YRD3_ARASU|nr:P-loop containing nucleoside triphosphate hydrolase [Arabidopsis suecica]
MIRRSREATRLDLDKRGHVDPSDVRKQEGDFGSAFEKTCQGKTEEVKLRFPGNMANEAEMIEKIAIDVSNRLNARPSRDFKGMVVIEAHLNKLDSLLCLGCDDVKMIGIWGPAGIYNLKQLEALAKELSLFGSGSQIIITTEDRRILKAHEFMISTLLVFFPKRKLLRSFVYLLSRKVLHAMDLKSLQRKKVAKLCGNHPSGLCVVGSSLRGETKDEWELQLYSLETSLDRKIEDGLRVGYEKLLKKHQAIFLHIACFFNNEDVDHVTSMLADSNLDVKNGLKILADKALVHISTSGKIVMHYLLQKLGKQEVVEQSSEPGKRQFLVEAEDILNVLANRTGSESVIGISFDMSKTEELFISAQAFERMRNLQFLRVSMGGSNENVSLGTLEKFLPRLEDMEFPSRLRYLHWSSYLGTSLLPTFRSEFLIELNMPSSKLEKLWGGIHVVPCKSEEVISELFN